MKVMANPGIDGGLAADRTRGLDEGPGRQVVADVGPSIESTSSPTADMQAALDAIDAMTPPDPSAMPWLPTSYWNAAMTAYYQQVIDAATIALANAQPPSREDFAHLPPDLAEVAYNDAVAQYYETRAALGTALADASIALMRLDPDFQSLPAETQAELIALIREHGTDSAAVRLFLQVASSPGFQSTNVDHQLALLALLGGHDDVARTARADLAYLFGTDFILEQHAIDPIDAFLSGVPEDVRESYREALLPEPQGANVLPWFRDERPEGIAERTGGEWTVGTGTTVEDHDFGSGTADAVRHEVTTGGHTIAVYLPADMSPAEREAALERIAESLSATPGVLLDAIERIDVNPADDGHGLMNAKADTGVIRINPSGLGLTSDNEFFSGILHEAGHLIDRAGTKLDDGRLLTDAWADAMASDGVPVSQADGVTEDFADAMALYLLVVGTADEARMRELYPERFAILDELLA